MNRTAWLLLVLACGGADEMETETEVTERTVQLDPNGLDLAGIQTAPAEAGTLPRTLDVPATLVLDPVKESRVGATAEGRVARVSARPGDRVKAGQTLAVVRSTAVASARADARAATSALQASQARRDRTALLLEDGIASKAQMLDAEAGLADAEAALATAQQALAVYGTSDRSAGPELPVSAATDGEVLQATATTGAWVTPGEELFHVGDRTELLVMLSVPEERVGEVVKGQTVRFVDGRSDVEGTVEAVAPWIDPDTRVVSVRARVPNPDLRLLPNQVGRAVVHLGDGDSGIVLPRSAVQELEGQATVFVQSAPGRFEARAVQVGAVDPDRALVDQGIEVGEFVVVSGAFALKGELVKGDLGGDDD